MDAAHQSQDYQFSRTFITKSNGKYNSMRTNLAEFLPKRIITNTQKLILLENVKLTCNLSKALSTQVDSANSNNIIIEIHLRPQRVTTTKGNQFSEVPQLYNTD
jgi:hypothetical protein